MAKKTKPRPRPYGCAIALLFAACTPSQLDGAKLVTDDVASYRALICGIAARVPDATLDKVRELCEAEADLREIAAEYAGCRK